MLHVWIDYSRYGHARKVRVQLFPEERVGLRVGTHVLAVGDSVGPREAVIVELTADGAEAVLELV